MKSQGRKICFTIVKEIKRYKKAAKVAGIEPQ